MGTPASLALRRARVFSPISSMASGGGPMKVTPASRQARANFAFSLKKPYPGWMASAEVLRTAARTFSIER